MANERVRKWAHNAAFERRFLGGPRVQNLSCTMQLARAIAYHRLPTENLSLASLAAALFGVSVDKTLQKADWSVRPLSENHIRYAAADTIWCARLRTALEAIAPPPSPEDDSPEAIEAEFPEAKLTELKANAELKALREAVRALMQTEGLERYSRFATFHSHRLEVPLRAFVTELHRFDPARILDVEMRVTNEKLDLLNGSLERVLSACRTSQNTVFRMPRMRLPRGPTLAYVVDGHDAERVTHDYEARAREVRIASSRIGELKQRMRAVLDMRGQTSFGDWSYAPGSVSRYIDVREALARVPAWGDAIVPLTKKFQLAIGEEAAAALAPVTTAKASTVIRWSPKREVVGLEAQESRWWSDSDDEQSGDAS